MRFVRLKILLATTAVILITAFLVYSFQGRLFSVVRAPTVEVVATNLRVPWEVVFLPDGDLLVTERPGILKKIGKNKKTYIIEKVEQTGESGLLGLALHPRFSDNHWVYLYLTAANNGGLKNTVVRYRLENDLLTDKKIIIDNIPGASFHNGGRIAFGPSFAKATGGKPDYYLYITTGDASQSNLAQDINSLAGKILRLKDDGSIPIDNPFDNAVWSYGHRNPQGLAWDDQRRLWATEHGRSGLLSGFDELNLIERGKNYGWPVMQGDEAKSGMDCPIIQSGPDLTWAPAGTVFWKGAIFFGGLKGETLYEAKISGDKQISLISHFSHEFGRIRAVVVGPDGDLYITTSNTDGRGAPRAGDDKIIRLNPLIFKR
jgi:glucose/arabinose dehydrogenase